MYICVYKVKYLQGENSCELEHCDQCKGVNCPEIENKTRDDFPISQHQVDLLCLLTQNWIRVMWGTS